MIDFDGVPALAVEDDEPEPRDPADFRQTYWFWCQTCRTKFPSERRRTSRASIRFASELAVRHFAVCRRTSTVKVEDDRVTQRRFREEFDGFLELHTRARAPIRNNT